MSDVLFGPAVVNLVGIVQNDSWTIALTLTSGDSPFDLTGATIAAKMVTAASSYVLTVVVTDELNGMLTISQTTAPSIDPSSAWAMRINGRTILTGNVSGMVDVLAETVS